MVVRLTVYTSVVPAILFHYRFFVVVRPLWTSGGIWESGVWVFARLFSGNLDFNFVATVAHTIHHMLTPKFIGVRRLSLIGISLDVFVSPNFCRTFHIWYHTVSHAFTELVVCTFTAHLPHSWIYQFPKSTSFSLWKFMEFSSSLLSIGRLMRIRYRNKHFHFFFHRNNTLAGSSSKMAQYTDHFIRRFFFRHIQPFSLSSEQWREKWIPPFSVFPALLSTYGGVRLKK